VSAPTIGVVARWTSRRRPAAGTICDECHGLLVDMECECCGQLAGEIVGMLAAVVDTAAGARLVIAEHTPDGWAAVQSLPATPANVAALSRPGATGPAPAASMLGGLW
jgi:hypothetical protein